MVYYTYIYIVIALFIENMFRNLLKSKKVKEIEAKTELIKAKAELNAAKTKFSDRKPSKYGKIQAEIEEITELKDVIGSGDTSKYLKLLSNPVVLSIIEKFLVKKGVEKTVIKDIKSKVIK